MRSPLVFCSYFLRSRLLASGLLASGLLALGLGQTPAKALPPPDDRPEEILRTEIILEARSPLDGKPLTASEYVELQAELAEAEHPPSLDPETQGLILQLQILKLINIVSPFQIP